MSTKYWVLLIVIILVIAGVVWYVYKPQTNNTMVTEQEVAQEAALEQSVASTTMEHVISYDGSSYNPNNITMIPFIGKELSKVILWYNSLEPKISTTSPTNIKSNIVHHTLILAKNF